MANKFILTDWIRRHRVAVNLLLTLAMLSNTATSFAYASSQQAHAPQSAMAGYHHNMSSPCCPEPSHQQSHCCQGSLCDCSVHCAPLLLSRQQPELTTLLAQAAPLQAESAPLPYVFPPPQRPPKT